MFGGIIMMEIMRALSAQVAPGGVGGTKPNQPAAGDPASLSAGDDAASLDHAEALDQAEPPEATELDAADAEPEPPEVEQPDFYKERMEQEAKTQEELDRIDEYDLTGEKRAAEALEREDALKEQSIEEKADSDKEFFAEQDRQKEEFSKEQDAEAERQLEEERDQEFWNDKKAEEITADLDKEVQAVDAEAHQEHEQGTLDEATAAEIGEQRDEIVGEHEGEFEKIDAAGETRKSEFWPGGDAKPEDMWPGELAKPQDFWPDGAEARNIDEKEEFFKDVDAVGPNNWIDAPPQETPADFFSNVDYIRNPDLPPGFMKPVEDRPQVDQETQARAQMAADYGQDGNQPPSAPPKSDSNEDLIKAYRDRLYDQGLIGDDITAKVQSYTKQLSNVDMESQLVGLDAQEVAKYKTDIQTDPNAPGKFEKGFEKDSQKPEASPESSPQMSPQTSNEALIKAYSDRLYDQGLLGDDISAKVREYTQQVNNIDLESQLVGLNAQEVATFKTDIQTNPNAPPQFDAGFANPSQPQPQPVQPAQPAQPAPSPGMNL